MPNDAKDGGLFFLDEKRGFVRARGGKLLATSDGGKTWLGLPATMPGGTPRIKFADFQVGWVCLGNASSTTWSYTVDGPPTPSDVHWLPDSRRILFVNDKGELVIVDADTKRRKVLSTRWPFQIADESVALAPDGRTVYVGARKVESDIWMVER